MVMAADMFEVWTAGRVEATGLLYDSGLIRKLAQAKNASREGQKFIRYSVIHPTPVTEEPFRAYDDNDEQPQ